MPRIHQYKGMVSNLYIVEDADGSLFMVDSGYALDVRGVLHALQDLGRDPKEVDLIVLTHHDADHSGGAAALRGVTRARVAMYATAAMPIRFLVGRPRRFLTRFATSMNHFILRGGYRRMLRQALDHRRRQRRRGVPLAGVRADMSPGERFGLTPDADILLEDRMPLPGHPDWAVIHTPGHSHGSICLHHKRSGALISGDTILADARSTILSPIYESRKELAQSLRRLQGLSVRSLYPGHGPVRKGRGVLKNVRRG